MLNDEFKSLGRWPNIGEAVDSDKRVFVFVRLKTNKTCTGYGNRFLSLVYHILGATWSLSGIWKWCEKFKFLPMNAGVMKRWLRAK